VVSRCDQVRREGAGWLEPEQKPSRWGLVVANNMRGTSVLGRGDLIGVGYVEFEAVGGAIKSRARGEALRGETKTEPPGLGFGERYAGASVLGRGT